jgi:hypothetical protein
MVEVTHIRLCTLQRLSPIAATGLSKAGAKCDGGWTAEDLEVY